MDDQTSSVLGSPEVWVILLGPSHSVIPKYGSNLCPSMDEWTKKMIDTHTHYTYTHNGLLLLLLSRVSHVRFCVTP